MREEGCEGEGLRRCVHAHGDGACLMARLLTSLCRSPGCLMS